MSGVNARNDDEQSQPETVEVDRMAAAATVARNVELADVHLRSLHADLHANRSAILNDQFHWRIEEPGSRWEFDEDDEALHVIAHVDVKAARQVSGASKHSLSAVSEESLVEIRIELALTYDLLVEAPPNNLRQPLFDAFAEINGIYNAFPYLREHVQSVTTRMGLPPVVLPVYRIPDSDEDEASSEDDD